MVKGRTTQSFGIPSTRPDVKKISQQRHMGLDTHRFTQLALKKPFSSRVSADITSTFSSQCTNFETFIFKSHSAVTF